MGAHILERADVRNQMQMQTAMASGYTEEKEEEEASCEKRSKLGRPV